MSAAFEARLEGLAAADARLARLDPLSTNELLEGLARLIQGQTRRRIEEEKTAPSGAAWKPNRAGTSTLFSSGMLSRSIDYEASAEQLSVGSGLIYAGIHQRGGTIVPKSAKRLVFRIGNALIFAMRVVIPARPFLGISAENEEEILDVVARFLKKRLG